MPIGTICNCLSVLFGGLIGSLLKGKIPRSIHENLPVLFGFCAIGISINSIIKVHSMTPVVLAILVGFVLGQLMHLEKWCSRFFRKLVTMLHLGSDTIDMEFYITAVALFCCSGFGWYSVLVEGITGDPGLLFSKSVLDFFTAVVFAASLGTALCAIPIPQFLILLFVFVAGKILSPWMSATMFADLSACGGIITIIAGMRVSKIKVVPIVDLMPALVLVMPFSMLWTAVAG